MACRCAWRERSERVCRRAAHWHEAASASFSEPFELQSVQLPQRLAATSGRPPPLRLFVERRGSVHIRLGTTGTYWRKPYMKRIIIAAVLAGSGLAAVPATAQYHYDYDDRPRRSRDYDHRRDHEYRRDYDRRPDYEMRQRGRSGPPAGGGALGSCATPRGSCQTPAQAPGSPCMCFVPGAGNTPGRVR
jgi:hypothetical protein